MSGAELGSVLTGDPAVVSLVLMWLCDASRLGWARRTPGQGLYLRERRLCAEAKSTTWLRGPPERELWS